MASVECAAHGPQSPRYVCVHIVQSLDTGGACGFIYDPEEPDEAVCDVCAAYHDTHGELPTDNGEFIGRLICSRCFEDAAKLHGIELPDRK